MDVIATNGKVSIHYHSPGKNDLVVAVTGNSIGVETVVFENALKKAIKEVIG